MIPIERVRASKISLPATRSSNTSQASNTTFIAVRVSLTQPHGQVFLDAADAVEVGVEAPAGRRFDQVEDVLAVAEAVERGRQRADLQAHLAEEQQEGRNPAQLGEDGPDVLRTGRGVHAHQVLGRVDERHFVGEARQPVDAVDQRGDLRVRPELGELLVAAMHVADHRVGGDHALAVEAHHQTERAVGRRMLRSEVEDHVAGVELDAHLRVGQVAERARIDVEFGQRRVGDAHEPASPVVAAAATASASASPSSGMPSTSTRPGHGFTTRDSSGKSFRSGWPSNSDGR